MKLFICLATIIFTFNIFAVDVTNCNKHLDGLWGNGIGRGFGFNSDGSIKHVDKDMTRYNQFVNSDNNNIKTSFKNESGNYTITFNRDVKNNSYSIEGIQDFSLIPISGKKGRPMAYDAWLTGSGMQDMQMLSERKTFKIVDDKCVLDRVTKTFKNAKGKETTVIELDMGVCQDLHNELKKNKKLRYCLSDEVKTKIQSIFKKNLPINEIKKRWISDFSLSSQQTFLERNVNNFELPEIVRGFNILSHCRHLHADVFYSESPGELPFHVPGNKRAESNPE